VDKSGDIHVNQIMLIGEFKHSIDSKKRLAIPSKLRKDMGIKIVLTRGLDNCLFVFTLQEWEKLADQLKALSFTQSNTRAFVRLLLSGASEVDIDALGRILVPDYLKEYAGLKKKVVIAGLYNRLEIWDEDKWEAYKKDMENKSDDIAEKLGELGMI
jgi:MraZ protein